MAAPPRCQFMELPQELREIIYSYAFTTDHDDEIPIFEELEPPLAHEIDLFRDASPPAKALCVTSRTIYEETHELYRKAFRSYWQDNSFHMIMHDPADLLAVWNLEDANTNEMRHLTIRLMHEKDRQVIYRLRSSGRSWSSEGQIVLQLWDEELQPQVPTKFSWHTELLVGRLHGDKRYANTEPPLLLRRTPVMRKLDLAAWETAIQRDHGIEPVALATQLKCMAGGLLLAHLETLHGEGLWQDRFSIEPI